MTITPVTREYTPGSCCISKNPMRYPTCWEIKLDYAALRAEQSRIPYQTCKKPRFSFFFFFICKIDFIVQSLVMSNSVTPMDSSTPGLPVYHQLLKLTQTHVHQVSDAIQLSHPLSSPSPPAFNLSQHQGISQGVSSHQVAKALELQLQHQSFQ